MDSLLAAALRPLIEAFDDMGIEYQLGGSIASSFHGVPRSSLDVDVLASISPEQVDALVERLKGRYYVAVGRARDSVARGTYFNVIHLESMMKIDIFVAQSHRFRLESLRRKIPAMLSEQDSAPIFMTSAEDIVLHKLSWFRKTGETSTQQWTDVIGVMKICGPALDRSYLARWAAELAVAELLPRAWRQAGSE
jgi:hypothetical protein